MGLNTFSGKPDFQCSVCWDHERGVCLGQPWGCQGQEIGLLCNGPVHIHLWSPERSGTQLWGVCTHILPNLFLIVAILHDASLLLGRRYIRS